MHPHLKHAQLPIYRRISRCSLSTDGVVVGLVMGRVDKRDGTFSRPVEQLVELIAIFPDLGRIPPAEFFPTGRIVSEPFSQFRARREFLCPMIDRSVGFSDASRPKPINQHPRAVVGCRGSHTPASFSPVPRGFFRSSIPLRLCTLLNNIERAAMTATPFIVETD